MAKPLITASDLATTCSARFYALPKPLTGVFVKGLFAEALEQYGAKKAAPPQIRRVKDKDIVYSFFCYGWESPVTFLKRPALLEKHFAFLLLIERRKHLAVFYKGGSGFDAEFGKVTQTISRQKLTHAWSTVARYQKLGTRRMAIARQELRGASYDADDLETSLPPSVATRSIPQSLRLEVADFGTIAITPGTGRVQKGGGKGGLTDLVGFVDDTIDQLGKNQESAFLKAFPAPMDLADLPAGVVPTGLLIDLAKLQDETMTDGAELSLVHTGEPAMDEEGLCALLAEVRELTVNPDGEWSAPGEEGKSPFATVSRLKHSFKLASTAFTGWSVQSAAGPSRPLAQWMRDVNAFSLTFTEPDYFYTAGHLYLKAGFAAEAAQMLKFLRVHATLDDAESEKGPYKDYPAATAHFSDDSIFRLVETDLANADTHLCCCDLGDEWADYLGFGPGGVTFYHCKDGSPTTGASDFQIVIGQALKNLARIRFRTDEIRTKLENRKDAATWSNTQIPLLVRPAGNWDGLIIAAEAAASAPDTVWTVALVVTALSRADFEAEAKKAKPKPSFIQLVWLLSAFASGCLERGAKPVVYCRT